MTIKRKCYICGKSYKTRRGLYYIKPQLIREKIDPKYKGKLSPMNKEEYGFVLCKQDAIKNKV